MSRYKIIKWLKNLLVYGLLLGFAYIMLFPFLFMFSTSFKLQTDTYRYPPRLIPMKPVEARSGWEDEPKPLYFVEYQGEEREFALLERSAPAGIYALPESPEETFVVALELVQPAGGEANQEAVAVPGRDLAIVDCSCQWRVT